MKPIEKQYDVGVIVGRFQVHDLHEGHRELIQYVVDRHSKVILVLGVSPLKVSTNNPLDIESRRQLIRAEFPDVNVVYVHDVNDNEVWSKRLDHLVAAEVSPAQTVVLYGSRDSFIQHYSGRYDTLELLQAKFDSGTAIRKEIASSSARASADFRAGVIWASQGRYPVVYPTLDVAVLNEDRTMLLLGRKPHEKIFRFFGGFADPADQSYEVGARREVMEEAGVEVGDLTYVSSHTIDDWRYRNEPDCIRTMLFVAQYLHGKPTPGDDIEEVRWFDLSKFTVVPEHRHLANSLVRYLVNQGVTFA